MCTLHNHLGYVVYNVCSQNYVQNVILTYYYPIALINSDNFTDVKSLSIMFTSILFMNEIPFSCILEVHDFYMPFVLLHATGANW